MTNISKPVLQDIGSGQVMVREPDTIAILNLLSGEYLTSISLVLEMYAAHTLEIAAAVS
jgi:hypothetical protein